MFGGFVVTVGDRAVSDASLRSQRVWTLFRYLAAHHDRFVPIDTLIDLLWPGEESYSPAKALQNLVYRLRGLLSDSADEGAEYIVYAHGAYSINLSAGVSIDIREFETCCKTALDTDIPRQQRLACAYRALELYGGDFLPESAGEEWVAPLASYYKRLCLQVAEECVDLLHEQQRHGEIVEVCEKAIGVDPFVERFHEKLIRALIDTGKTVRAIAQYEYICALLQKELGSKPSDELQELAALLYQSESDAQCDLAVVVAQMAEDERTSGAFLCSTDVFKQFFRLEVRSATRAGQTLHIGMITLTDNEHKTPPTATLKIAMNTLKKCCVKSLRRNDIVTQYNKSQMLILLPFAKQEHLEIVFTRIKNCFAAESNVDNLLLSTSVQAADVPLA